MMVFDKDLELKREEQEWRNQLFLHQRNLWQELYGPKPSIDESLIEHRVPQTIGEIAEAIDMIKKAGGPELILDDLEPDDDWSWIERFKKEQASNEPHIHDNVGDVDTFDALHSQDIDDL